MNNTKLTQIVALLLLVILFSAHKLNASTNLNIELLLNTSNLEQRFEILEILNDITPEKETAGVSIEIFDQNFNIIAFGKENEGKINTLIKKSDLITEISGKKYLMNIEHKSIDIWR